MCWVGTFLARPERGTGLGGRAGMLRRAELHAAGQGTGRGKFLPDSASRPAVPDLLLDSAAFFCMHVPTFISSF